MSILELIGLDALLQKSGGLAGIVGGLLFIIGIGAWMFLSMVAGRYMDISAVAWNLIPAILLLGFHIVRTILSITKNKDDNVIINIIIMVLIVVCFIYGLNHPYKALIFSYEYRPIWSGIAYTLYPNIIRLIIDGFSIYNSSIFERLSVLYKALGVYVFTFMFVLFVGQGFSVLFYFTGKTDIYDGIAYYHNTAYNKARIEYKDKTTLEFLNERYKLVDEHYKKVCSERHSDLQGEQFEKQCKATQEGINGSMYIETMNSATRKKYGYYIVGHYPIKEEYKDVIKVIDKEWNTFTYYILDRNYYSVQETTKDYYNEVRNS